MTRSPVALVILLAACGPDVTAPDAGRPADAGSTVDAGTAPPDAGTNADAGATVDAGATPDAGAEADAGAVLDAGTPVDAGTADAGASDAGAFDAGATVDAGTADAGASDAGAFDAGASDSGVPDAGRVDAGTTFDAGCLVVTFDQLPDGGAWPADWTISGGVAAFTINAGSGAWSPVLSNQPYSLARLAHPGCGATELAVRFDAWLPPRSGLGFYVRSNGGFLAPRATTPGQGYALFLETFRDRTWGLWRERNGVEFELRPVFGVTPSNTWVRARFVVQQLPLADGGANPSTTQLRGRVWTPPAPEPTTWTEFTDSSPELQASTASTRIAIDSFNDVVPGRDAGVPVFIDNVEITRLR